MSAIGACHAHSGVGSLRGRHISRPSELYDKTSECLTTITAHMYSENVRAHVDLRANSGPKCPIPNAERLARPDRPHEPDDLVRRNDPAGCGR
jgi:hypothetical protein